jgi:hypothetical protein
MEKDTEKAQRINKNLSTRTGNENEIFEIDDDKEAFTDLVDVMSTAKKAFNLGNQSISRNYRTPGEILNEYNSFDE